MNLKFIAVAVSMVTAQSNGYAVNAPTSSGDAMTEQRLRGDPFQVSFVIRTHCTGTFVSVLPTLVRKYWMNQYYCFVHYYSMQQAF